MAQMLSKTSGSGHALVVDDDACVRQLICLALQQIGFKVDQAEDGRQAYGAFVQGRFDLVITDYQMPVMDGLALIASIKNKSPATPVILVSGQLLDASLLLCSEGVVLLQKPFDLETLHRTALAACAQSRPGQDAPKWG